MTPRIDHRRRLVAYGTGGFALAVNAMIQFLLPLRAVELGMEITLVGLLLAAKALTEALVAMPLGQVLDRIGVRAAFLIGTGSATLVLLAYSLATSFVVLLLLQVALGMSRPLAWIGAQHYVSGMRTGAEQAYDTGRLSFVANAGQIVGPLLIGVVASTVGLRGAFVALAVYASVFFLLGLALPSSSSAMRGKTSTGASSRERGLTSALRLLAMPGMQVAMLLTAARLWIPTAWTSFFPLYLVVEAQLSEAVAGTVISTMALTATVVSLFTGRLSKLGRAESVTAAALAVAAVGLAIGPLLGGSPLVYLSAVLVGIGHGVSLPMLIVIVSNAAPEGQRGLALGLRTTFNQGAAMLAPLTVAPIIAMAGIALAFPVAGAVAGAAVLAASARDWSASHRPAGQHRPGP